MKILYSPETIQNRVNELGRAISYDYDSLIIVVVLNGAVIFASDLIRQISIPVELDTISVSSYKGTQSGGIEFKKDIDIDVTSRDVLFVEDIIDTGQTMKYLFELFKERGAASVKLCSFLSKPGVEINIDYLGFNIPDLFVVGYGLDYDGRYRGLPDIRVL